MGAKCLTLKDVIRNFIDNNIVKILLSLTLTMIFLIANSQVLICAAIYGTWFVTFFSLMIVGLLFSYALVEIVFQIIGK